MQRTASIALLALLSLLSLGWTAAVSPFGPRTRDRSDGAWRVARAHRPLGIPLPDGSTLLLRREYRAFYRALVVSHEGLVLEKAYHASRNETAGSIEA